MPRLLAAKGSGSGRRLLHHGSITPQQSQFSRPRACWQRGLGGGRRLLHHGSITLLQQLRFSCLRAYSPSWFGSRGTERNVPSFQRRRPYLRPGRRQQVLQQWKLEAGSISQSLEQSVETSHLPTQLLRIARTRWKHKRLLGYSLCPARTLLSFHPGRAKPATA